MNNKDNTKSKIQFLLHFAEVSTNFLSPPPQWCVSDHSVVDALGPETCWTRGTIVVNMTKRWRHRVRQTLPSQTWQRIVIMNQEHGVRVEDCFIIKVDWFDVLCTPVDVMQHVDTIRQVTITHSHGVKKIHCSEVPARSGLVQLLQSFTLHNLHHVRPVYMILRNYHFINIQESNVLIIIEVPVDTVIVSDELLSPLVVDFVTVVTVVRNSMLKILNLLQISESFRLIEMQNFLYILVNFENVEKYSTNTKHFQKLNPFN